jgi:hypothetical protein
MSTCRFCNNWRDQGVVKYGPRHYAHFRCFLEKKLDLLPQLPGWKLGEFPFRLLREFKVTDENGRFVDPAVQRKFDAAEVPFRSTAREA